MLRNELQAQVARLTEIFWAELTTRMTDDEIRGDAGWARMRSAIADAAWKAAKEINAPCDEGLLAQVKARAMIVPKEVGIHQTHIDFGDDGYCELALAICEHGEWVTVKVYGEGKDADG